MGNYILTRAFKNYEPQFDIWGFEFSDFADIPEVLYNLTGVNNWSYFDEMNSGNTFTGTDRHGDSWLIKITYSRSLKHAQIAIFDKEYGRKMAEKNLENYGGFK